MDALVQLGMWTMHLKLQSESMCLCVQLLQYKKRCGNLEQQVLEKTSESEKLRLSVRLSGELYSLLL